MDMCRVIFQFLLTGINAGLKKPACSIVFTITEGAIFNDFLLFSVAAGRLFSIDPVDGNSCWCFSGVFFHRKVEPLI